MKCCMKNWYSLWFDEVLHEELERSVVWSSAAWRIGTVIRLLLNILSTALGLLGISLWFGEVLYEVSNWQSMWSGEVQTDVILLISTVCAILSVAFLSTGTEQSFKKSVCVYVGGGGGVFVCHVVNSFNTFSPKLFFALCSVLHFVHRIAPTTNVDWVTVVAAPVSEHGVNPHTKPSRRPRGHLFAAKVNQ